MKYTNLDMVQSVLSSMDSDEIDSVNDTTESRQVLEILRTKYFDIIARAHLPEQKQLFQLTASGDPDLPVVMYKPDTVRSIEWLKYHHVETGEDIDAFEYVTILPLQQFLDMMHQMDPDGDDIDSLTLDSFTFYFRTDRQPKYCTVLNDDTLVFDSFDLDEDTTLQTSKTMAYGLTNPSFEMTDDFVPDLDDLQFPLLLSEVKALAHVELKQAVHPKAEQEAKRQWSALEKTKRFPSPNWFADLPDFGRRGHRARPVIVM